MFAPVTPSLSDCHRAARRTCRRIPYSWSIGTRWEWFLMGAARVQTFKSREGQPQSIPLVHITPIPQNLHVKWYMENVYDIKNLSVMFVEDHAKLKDPSHIRTHVARSTSRRPIYSLTDHPSQHPNSLILSACHSLNLAGSATYIYTHLPPLSSIARATIREHRQLLTDRGCSDN